MYNGIGLPTARGSGTNGFVQRNLAHVKKTRTMRIDHVSEPDPEFLEPPNLDIIAHQRKRKIEAKCFDLREELEGENWNKEEIDRKVNRYRKRKLEELEKELEHEKERRIEIRSKIEERALDRQKRFKVKKEELKEEQSTFQPVKVKAEVKTEIKKEKDE